MSSSRTGTKITAVARSPPGRPRQASRWSVALLSSSLVAVPSSPNRLTPVMPQSSPTPQTAKTSPVGGNPRAGTNGPSDGEDREQRAEERGDEAARFAQQVTQVFRGDGAGPATRQGHPARRQGGAVPAVRAGPIRAAPGIAGCCAPTATGRDRGADRTALPTPAGWCSRTAPGAGEKWLRPDVDPVHQGPTCVRPQRAWPSPPGLAGAVGPE